MLVVLPYVIHCTLDLEGSCDKVGTADGVLERAVGPRVLEGLLEGEGVGFGESVGVLDGLRDLEGV